MMYVFEPGLGYCRPSSRFAKSVAEGGPEAHQNKGAPATLPWETSQRAGCPLSHGFRPRRYSRPQLLLTPKGFCYTLGIKPGLISEDKCHIICRCLNMRMLYLGQVGIAKVTLPDTILPPGDKLSIKSSISE